MQAADAPIGLRTGSITVHGSGFGLNAADGPRYQLVGPGLCDPIGHRMFDGTGDNDGTLHERAQRCGSACFNQDTPTEFKGGTWSSRGAAVGFGVVLSSGRCYCNHEQMASCTQDFPQYEAYEFVDGSDPSRVAIWFRQPDWW